MTISLKCSCGLLQGTITKISPRLNKRFVCMCNDCQAYAHFLGKTAQVLDRNGGTEIVPVHPAQIKITRGIELLTCVRLSSDGMIRWYAGCCKTPVANTHPSHKMPFAGVVHTFMESSKVLGPICARVNGKYGYGQLPPETSQNAPLKLILNTICFLFTGLIKKLQAPSPFFNTVTGKPTVEPLVLSDAEYDNLIKLCGRAPNMGKLN